MSDIPTVFLSAASDDLRDWRDVIHKALERGGCKVFTQGQSLKPSTKDVLGLLKQHIDQSDFVIHLSGVAYGGEPDGPPFRENEAQLSFKCSYTQFEYYYARKSGKPVYAFVCDKTFPYMPFVEKGANDEDRLRRRALQEAHRERIASGRFNSVPLSLPNERPIGEHIIGLPELLQALMGTLADIGACSDACTIKIWQELEVVAAKRHDELVSYIKDLPIRVAEEVARTKWREHAPPFVPEQEWDIPDGLPSIENLKFRYRWLPTYDRPVECAALKEFLDAPANLSWWGMFGDGGTGKSRLAYELIRDQSSEANQWDAGFLRSDRIDWLLNDCLHWAPEKPTLIVIDYASQFPTQIRHGIINLSQVHLRAPDAYPIRLLLLDRPGTLGPMFSELLHNERSEALALNTKARRHLYRRSGQPTNTDYNVEPGWKPERSGRHLAHEADFLEVPPIERTKWPFILDSIVTRCGGQEVNLPSLSESAWWDEVDRITGHGRLLSLQVLGLLLVQDPGLVKRILFPGGNEGLLNSLLANEYDRHWSNCFLDTEAEDKKGPALYRHPLFKLTKQAIGFATLARGLTWPTQSQFFTRVNPCTETDVDQLTLVLPRILHHSERSKDPSTSAANSPYSLSPLEPDLIGEYLLLDVLATSSPKVAAASGGHDTDICHHWLNASLSMDSNGTMETLKNMAKDFPQNAIVLRFGTALLRQVIGLMDALDKGTDPWTPTPEFDARIDQAALFWTTLLSEGANNSADLGSALAAEVGRSRSIKGGLYRHILHTIDDPVSGEQKFNNLKGLINALLFSQTFRDLDVLMLLDLTRWAGHHQRFETLGRVLELLRHAHDESEPDPRFHLDYTAALVDASLAYGKAKRPVDFDHVANELLRVAEKWPEERDIQYMLAKGAVNATSAYGEVGNLEALGPWARVVVDLANGYLKDPMMQLEVLQAAHNMAHAFSDAGEEVHVQSWLGLKRTALRNMALGLTMSIDSYIDEKDFESAYACYKALASSAEDFPDGLVQKHFATGSFLIMAAAEQPDIDWMLPIRGRAETALSKAAVDEDAMNFLVERVYTQTEREGFETYRMLVLAWLVHYWPGFVPAITPRPLSLVHWIPIMSGSASDSDQPKVDWRDTWKAVQEVKQRVIERHETTQSQESADITFLWEKRMFLSDRGDSLLPILEANKIQELIAEYHTDPWRQEDLVDES